jgi:hypothetical protein
MFEPGSEAKYVSDFLSSESLNSRTDDDKSVLICIYDSSSTQMIKDSPFPLPKSHAFIRVPVPQNESPHTDNYLPSLPPLSEPELLFKNTKSLTYLSSAKNKNDIKRSSYNILLQNFICYFFSGLIFHDSPLILMIPMILFGAFTYIINTRNSRAKSSRLLEYILGALFIIVFLVSLKALVNSQLSVLSSYSTLLTDTRMILQVIARLGRVFIISTLLTLFSLTSFAQVRKFSKEGKWIYLLIGISSTGFLTGILCNALWELVLFHLF